MTDESGSAHGTSNHDDPTVDLSIVFPAYNERRRIVPTIASTVAYLRTLPISWEIIISDDGSTDGTGDVVAQLALDEVRVVGGGVNEGKGAAVRRGLSEATGRAVLVSDSDMSTPIQELSPMLTKLHTSSSMVIGSRAESGADVIGKSRLRNLLSSSLSLIVRHGLGISVADTQCGFKLMTSDVADLFVREQSISGFSFDLEWLYICGQHGVDVVEHPVEWFDAPGSTVDPIKDSLRFLRDIAKVRWSRRRSTHGQQMFARSIAPLRIGVVSSLPPSTRTLNEYGLHLVTALIQQPEIERITVLRDDTVDSARPIDGVDTVAAWSPDDWTNPIRILRAARRAQVEAVFFNLQFATFGDRRVPAALGLLTPALLRLCRIPTVVMLHNLVDTVDLEAAGFTSNRWKAAAYRAIGRLLTRTILLANRVAVTLPSYYEILTERYGADNVYLSPHGTFPHPAIELPAEAVRSVLTFGKFGTYKRVEELVEAFRLVRAAGHTDIELVIAGTDAVNTPGYLDSVQATIGDDEPIRFTGYVDEDDVPLLFEQAEMVVFPYTSTTGSSGPLHQAGAAGRAAVLPEIGDFIDVISTEGFVGETFTPGDTMSLASAINRLLDDDERRIEMGRQNRRAAGALDIELIAGWHSMHLAATARN